MRMISLALTAALLGVLHGCGAAPTDGSSPALNDQWSAVHQADNQGRVFVAGNAALATQIALYHVLASFNGASTADLGKANPLAGLGTVDPDAHAVYDVQLGTGKGHITVTRDGKTTIDLAFDFSRTDGAHGFRYDATNVAGKVEGYDVAMGPIVLDFERMLDGSGQEITNPDGTKAWDVKLDAGGQLAYKGDVVASLKTAGFELAWPLPATGTKVGTLLIDVPGQQATFEGDAFVGGDSVTTHAKVTFADDPGSYLIDVSGLGKIAVTAQQ